jgi:hypothetical protein
MAGRIQHRRDTAAVWEFVNPVLASGEFGVVTDEDPQRLKLGDGVTEWNDLPFFVNDGSDGEPGIGIPDGGVAGQVLVKNSSDDYDTTWGFNVSVGDTPPANPSPGDIWLEAI